MYITTFGGSWFHKDINRKVKVSWACKLKGLSDPNCFGRIREANIRKMGVDCEGMFVSGCKPGIGGIHRVRLHDRSGFP